MKKAKKIFIAFLFVMFILFFWLLADALYGQKKVEQKKIKTDTVIIDSTKFLRYYIVKRAKAMVKGNDTLLLNIKDAEKLGHIYYDTIKIDTLPKAIQHQIRMQQILKKKIK